ncbi:MAG: hypothetical protein IIA60_13435, partial [Candidatus Marinimicrobia bacterium]|nr:hypothetical protein [Candidatus Neomarinimicrobiota bacterium]
MLIALRAFQERRNCNRNGVDERLRSADQLVAAYELATELGEEPLMTFVGLTVFSIATNVMPDYISLLQSRWTIAWAAKGGRIIVPLLADLILTSFVSAG